MGKKGEITTTTSTLVRILSIVIYRNPTETRLSKTGNLLVLATGRSTGGVGWGGVGGLCLQIWLDSEALLYGQSYDVFYFSDSFFPHVGQEWPPEPPEPHLLSSAISME